MNGRLIFTLSIIFILTGCSYIGGDKNTKKLVADGLTPKELYEQADAKVSAGSLEQAIDQYELLVASYPYSKYSIQARLDIAFNLLKRKKYNRSIQELDKFIKSYPDSQPIAYAYYLRGVAAEKKSHSILDDLLTDNAQRDVQSLKDAFDYFSILIKKFPDSKYSIDAQNRLVKIVNALARHELYVAIYYTRIGANIAGINRTKYIIETYPTSESVPDSLHLMAYNYDLINATDLAANSRSVLNLNFPEYTPSYSLNN